MMRRVRVCFEYADEEFLYVHPVDEVSETCWKVRYHVPGVNDEFSEGVPNFWRYAQLNLLDVYLNDDGTYTPSFIVLEPDYLLDISSLAECYRDYGSHPANYLMSRLVPIDNARPLLLGNIAKLLDSIPSNWQFVKICLIRRKKKRFLRIVRCISIISVRR